ncbi:MAG: STAS/SEC14 domain-containing protein [Gemmatimonadaceae bacterium]|nr:STAS/SEC14 domain-containing protein [Caulobacter sp.]
MASRGAIDLLVDASHLEGWDSLAALDKHVAFLKARQSKVDHVAVIISHEWQQWLIGAVRPFLHPQIALFVPGHEEAALRWITRHRQAGEGETVSSAGGEPFEGLVADIADGRWPIGWPEYAQPVMRSGGHGDSRRGPSLSDRVV